MADDRTGQALEELAASSSRRGFLARVGGAIVGISAGGVIARLVQPGEVDAFHFCGHIFTTGSCPHPDRLPRINRDGYPVRVDDGRAIDNLGRLVNDRGEPVDEDGSVKRDPDGRPMPPAPRTRICDQVAERFEFRTWTDGSWYRCCGGKVRKLVDCCSYNNKRINGDEALTGYCFKRRKVFCVMYYDTHVKC
jgi:hypothetical protein